MKNFFIGILLTILVIVSWPHLNGFINSTQVTRQPINITIDDGQMNTRTTFEKPIITNPITQATPAVQRSKAHESIKELFEAGERVGRRND